MTSDQPKLETPSKYPATSGLIDDARLRGTDVMLAAAARSPGETIAITYELRVGTSICDNALRTRSRTMTQPRSGTNGTNISSRLDGRCVNTIVLTSPSRWALGKAARCGNAG